MQETLLTPTAEEARILRLSRFIREIRGADELRLFVETYIGTISQSPVLARMSLEKMLPYVVPTEAVAPSDLLKCDKQRSLI